MIILVDMDGVLANFEKGVLDSYRNRHPDQYYIPLEKRTDFRVQKEYPPELQPLIQEIYRSQGFFLNLPPIEGALEGLSKLSQDHQVYICTSPLLSNPFCLKEKYDWVIKHLGKSWTKQMVVTKDKTIVNGDLLIDDKPEISGKQVPKWEHILYSQPYNRQISSKRRITWENWQSVIK